MRQQQREQTARLRAELVVQVRSGALTAAAAARRLGVSRKTYYKWERRGLEAMMGALNRRSGGRPRAPTDEEKLRMRREIRQLHRKLLLAEQRLTLQSLVRQHGEDPAASRRGAGTKKKERVSGDDR